MDVEQEIIEDTKSDQNIELPKTPFFDANEANSEDDLNDQSSDIETQSGTSNTQFQNIEINDSITKRTLRKRKANLIKSNSNVKKRQKIIFDNKSFQTSFESLKSGFISVFGQGDAGQLGLGTDNVECTIPHPVDLSGQRFKQISCGGMHTLILSEKGEIYSCGCNDEGALGREVSDDSDFTFHQIKIKDFIHKVFAGDSFSVALTKTGKVYAWGTFRDSNGVIGLINFKKIEKKPIIIYKNEQDVCVDICGGINHLLILTQRGIVLSCGTGQEGQLGRVSSRFADRGGRRGIKELLSLKQVIFPTGFQSGVISKGKVAKRIFASNCSSFAIFQNGTIYGWGLNANGQVLRGEDEIIYFPKSLNSVIDKLSVNCKFEPVICGGYMHTLVLNEKEGIIYSAGSHLDCCLGRSDISPEFKPIDIPQNQPKFISCACGDTCSFSISSDNALYSWGLGCTEQLGAGHGGDITTPTLVSTGCLKDANVIQISAGGQHTAVLYLPSH